jgi:hypothetical protein
MKQHIKFLLCIVLLNSFSLSLAFAQRATKIPDDPKVIPQDFGSTKSTVLVVNYGKKGIDKYLEKDFSKEYKGEYVIIEKDELGSKTYKDVSIYRYVFELVDDYVPGRFTGNGDRQAPVMNYHINFTDRSNFTVYKTLISSNFFSKLVKAYIERLNDKIAANEKK